VRKETDLTETAQAAEIQLYGATHRPLLRPPAHGEHAVGALHRDPPLARHGISHQQRARL
jgi:hypothetical protein